MNMRKLTALLGAFALTFGVASTALATAPTGHQVTICHATDSFSHPFVTETVDISSSGHLRGGHDTQHTGPLFNGTVKNWGDIIPPYQYTNTSGTFTFPGLNWPAGATIYNSGCTIPGEPAHNPAIHVVKSPSTTTLSAGGGEVTYTYTVTNTGDVPLSNVTVSDNKCSPVDYVSGDTHSDGVLALDETWIFSCKTTLTATTTNTATATGHYGNTTVTDTDEATVTVAASGPAIHVVKSADPTTLPAGGGPVEYTYLVTNTGNVDLTGVTVTDNKCSPLTGPTGDAGSDHILGLTETWTYTCTTSLTETTTNTVTATGHDGETTVSDTADATVTVAPAVNTPGITVDKTAVPTTLPATGGDITYTYVVTNTGNTALTNIVLTDDNGTPGNTGDDFTVTCPHDSLAVATQMTCTAAVTGTTKTTTNIATVTAKSGEATVSDTDSATVTVLGSGVQGETSPPKVTAPPTDAFGGTSSDSGVGGSLPLLLIVMGIIGLGAVLLTPTRNRR